MATTTALRKMRIFAIPLTRPRVPLPSTGPGSTSKAKLNRLTYYQFQFAPKRETKPPAGEGPEGVNGDGEPEKKRRKSWLPEEGIVNYATQKAADIWAGFGKAEGGWKLKTYQVGEKLVDRLEFEELALKSIESSLGPSIKHFKRNPVDIDEKWERLTIPLIFPPSILSPTIALSELQAYIEHRIPRHKRGFYIWMILAPFTAPFMIIPIVPNLPFFFCVWRSWSHYKAYRSSQYLQSLLEHDVIVPEPNEPLDEVYKMYKIAAPPSLSSKPEADSTTSQTASSSTPEAEPKHDLLLTRDAVPVILSTIGFKPDSTAAADLYRAVEQARVRVASGRTEL